MEQFSNMLWRHPPLSLPGGWILENKSKGFWKCKKRRLYMAVFVLLFLIETFIAIFIKDAIIRPYIGDILVVPVVYTFVRIFVPEGLKWLWGYVVLFAVAVEISQYFQMAKLLGLESNRLARVIIGSVFDWKDIVCYIIGGALIVLAEKWLLPARLATSPKGNLDH